MLGKIKKNWAKYLALVIVAIFVLLGAYVVIKPGWKEYQGDGFSFRYPGSWILQHEFPLGSQGGFELSTNMVSREIPFKNILLIADRSFIDKPGVNYFDDPKSFYAIYEDNPQFKAIDNYSFDNKRAVFASFREPLSGEYWELYWVKSDHYRYDISLFYEPAAWKVLYYKTIVGPILSTMHLEN